MKMILVVRDERHAQVKRGRGNPSVGGCNRSPVAPRPIHRFGAAQSQGVGQMLDDVPFQT